MYSALTPGAIGVRAARLDDAISLARLGGFDGVDFSPHEVANLIDNLGVDAVRSKFADAGVRPAGWGLTVDWRGSEESWNKGLEELPRLASAASSIGGNRTSTWVMPCSEERVFEENFAFHIARFTPIARILGEYGCRLGLEYIGPKTLRDSQKYPFVHTQTGMLDLAAQIGPNVGLLLDCWHWYTSHGSLAELQALDPEKVVYVHVNDAPAGVSIDAQVDNVRGLPGETGVIDIKGFLSALRVIGYDGPVAPEPFKTELADLPTDHARVTAVGAAMQLIFGE